MSKNVICDRAMDKLDSMNYFELMEVKSRLEKKYNKFKGQPVFFELLNDIYDDLLEVEKFINKFNKYRTVKIFVDGDYSYDKTIYIIKGAKKREVLKWLNKNGLKVGYDIYNCYGGFDCTGRLSSRNVEVKGNRVIIEKCYDL